MQRPHRLNFDAALHDGIIGQNQVCSWGVAMLLQILVAMVHHKVLITPKLHHVSRLRLAAAADVQ